MDKNYLDIPPEDMDREKTLELIKDVEKWNAYREKWIFWNPNLEKTSLFNTNLEGANLLNAKLKGAILSWAKLEGTNLINANLKEANLGNANLEGADLRMAKLEGAILRNANLEGAVLDDAKLEGANLSDANINNIDILYTDLRGADLRGAKNVVFDQTLIEGCLLSPNSDEPWTVLRRNYTGSKLLFHLLLLIAFLIPLVSKTFLWNAVAQGEAFIDNPAIEALPERYVISLLVGMPGSREAWVSMDTVWFVASLLVIAYNAARALLTINVGHMREELESTGTSPKYHEDFPKLNSKANIKKALTFINKSESIDWLLWIHNKSQWLLYVGGGLAAINVIRWLFTTVHAPV